MAVKYDALLDKIRESDKTSTTSSSGDLYATQRLVNTASPSPILATDGAILFDTTSTAIAISLPAASVGKITIPFKDIGGNAATNNITINAVGGDTIVDVAVGQTSTVIVGDGFSGAFISNGVNTWYLTCGAFGGGGLDSAAVEALIASELADSPTLVTPALGTPSSGVLTSCTGPLAGETATAGSAVTTLTLTPAATLTDGVYDVLILIKSLSTTSIFNIGINADVTDANYRSGYHQSLAASAGGAEGSARIGFLSDNGNWATVRMTLYVTGGLVSATMQQARQRSSTGTGRSTSAAFWHSSATTVTSIEVTATIATTIETGSKISIRRVG